MKRDEPGSPDQRVAEILLELCSPAAVGEPAAMYRERMAAAAARLKREAPEAMAGIRSLIEARNAERAVAARKAAQLH